MKRIGSILLALTIVFTCIPISLTVSATQSKSGNFSTSYTLTGNYRNDIVAVANAQYLKTKSQLGYTEGWCADFVCDCAKLAGIPNFPFYGGVDGLKTRLVTWGGTWYSSSSGYTPQKGDIVFLSTFPSYTSTGGLDHVGIVTSSGFNSNGTVNTIEGNTSSDSTSEMCVNKKSRKLMPSSSSSSTTMYVVGYVTLTTCNHSYGGTGICSSCNYQFPYNNDRNTSYAGTYKVKSGATAYIRKGPYQKCTEVTRATSGNFTVVARVLNCKGNYWYELSYNGSTCYVVSTNLEKVSHTHSYSYGYESAHPHKQYKSCSCGEYSYTGSTRTVSSCTTCYPQASYGSTNPDDYVYPERSLIYTSPTMKGEDVAWVQSVLYQLGYSIDVDGSYGKNSVATIEQFQTDYGLTVDGHCGPATRAKLLELWNAKKHTHSYSSTYADANHPHKEYKQCSCGDKQYTGSNYASWEGSSYEAAHPHRVYRTCWCGYYEYTGDYETVGTCNDCINDSFTTRSRCNNRTYDVYMISTTWTKAKEFCESKGGHLMVATDKTKEENAHMSSLIYGNVCWISGSQNRYMYAGVTTNETTTANMFICEYDPYTVSFEANGGEGTPEPVVKAHDETAYLYTNVPTREGYKFIGWSTDPNATAGSYWYGSSYTANSNITLYAIWRTESFNEKHDYDDNLYYYSYKLDGVNTNRGVASVILYNQNYGSNTMTNEYGCEASVDSTGKVISNVYGVGSATIPDGGFVLSSHSAQDNIFVTDYVKVGDYVYFDSSAEVVYVFPTQEKMKAFLKCRYGHSGTEVVKNNVEPTYDTFGYSGDTCCSVCNELMFRGQYLDMLIRNGDIDNDGIVDNLDRLSITRYLAGWEEYTEESVDIEASDLNNDGFVDNLDRLILTRHLANWSGYEELPYTG